MITTIIGITIGFATLGIMLFLTEALTGTMRVEVYVTAPAPIAIPTNTVPPTDAANIVQVNSRIKV